MKLSILLILFLSIGPILSNARYVPTSIHKDSSGNYLNPLYVNQTRIITQINECFSFRAESTEVFNVTIEVDGQVTYVCLNRIKCGWQNSSSAIHNYTLIISINRAQNNEYILYSNSVTTTCPNDVVLTVAIILFLFAIILACIAICMFISICSRRVEYVGNDEEAIPLLSADQANEDLTSKYYQEEQTAVWSDVDSKHKTCYGNQLNTFANHA